MVYDDLRIFKGSKLPSMGFENHAENQYRRKSGNIGNHHVALYSKVIGFLLSENIIFFSIIVISPYIK